MIVKINRINEILEYDPSIEYPTFDILLVKAKKTILKLFEEDGQPEKLEENRINVKKGLKPFFRKDVNDPSERGHD